MSPPKLPFDELPKSLRNKIEISAGREKTACWHWIGEVKASRRQVRQYPATDNYRPGPSGRSVQERATPRGSHPLTKAKTDAHRLVYAFATCTAIDDVPRLQRCSDDRCVSPWCVVPGILTSAQRKRAERLQPAAVAATVIEDWTAELCLVRLRDADVSPNIEKDSAADEASIPRDKLTDDCWAQYVRECPEYDDDN